MNGPTYEQIEAIVRAVLASMAGPKAVQEAEPTFEERLIGLKAAEGFPRGARILVRSGTVITPLARDWMKKQGV
jgi:hypothetical protein